MATETELEAIEDQLLERIGEVLDEQKPSYRVGSRSVDWTEYLSMLMKQLDSVRKQIALVPGEARSVFDDPYL